MQFDSKSFNEQAFKYIADRIPNVKRNELIKSRALVRNADIRSVLTSQNGSGYARIAMRGLLDGDALNYDGETDISATSTKTFERGVVVVGRSKAWEEKDFSYDITGGVDFMQNVAVQVSEYWFEIDQATLLSVLKGVFSMTGTKNQEFIDAHTFDVTGADDGLMKSTTLNSAMQNACGDNRGKFSMAIMHSSVATNLENLNLVKHLTYTDKDGMTRDIEMYTWNGRTVIIDDSLAGVAKEGYTEYTTYVLGNGSFDYEDIGAKKPYEMARDPKTKGGVDLLYTRHRKVFAPYGISYEKTSQVTNSPTAAELENGANWSLVASGETDPTARTYINHKAIPIARIISKG